MSNPFDRIKLTLYPRSHDPSKQGFDNADIQLINHIETLAQRRSKTALRLLVVNDTYGALSCLLCSAHKIIFWSDSHLSHIALSNNLASNQQTLEVIDIVNDKQLDHLTLNRRPDAILYRAVKNSKYVEYQLDRLSRLFSGTPIYFGLMQKQINANLRDVIDTSLNKKLVGRAEKKARVVSGYLKSPSGETRPPFHYYDVAFNGRTIKTANLPNVFSARKLDVGTRFLLQHFPMIEKVSAVADIGCGNGLLSCAAASLYPSSEIHAFDESYHAVESARETAKINQFNNVSVYRSDSLQASPLRHYDLIVCNPPFHHGVGIELDNARRMFSDAQLFLAEQGQFWLVANRHLPYQTHLNRLFSNVIRVTESPKFVIYCCKK